MSKLPAALFFVSALLSAVIVFAETPGQGTKPAPAPAAVPEADAPAVQSRMQIDIKGDLLTIDLVDAEFGSVMQAIAAKAGVKVDMSGPIQQKRLTTKFSGIELERGISRLMTLMQEKNYTMKYDSRGRVSALEVYGAEPAAVSQPRTGTRPEPQKNPQKSVQKTLPPAPVPSEQPAVPGVQKNPPPQRRLIPPSKQAGPSVPPSAKSRKTDPYNEDEGEENVEELPYITPQKKMPAATQQQQ